MTATSIADFTFANRSIRMLTAKGEADKAASLAQGTYQHPKPPLVMAIALRRPGLVVDVGAGSGIYTVLAASASQGTRVLAVEPLPEALDFLRENLRLNALGQQVDVVASAMGAGGEDAVLHVPSQDHGLLETSASLVNSPRSASKIVVCINTLDQLLNNCGAVCLIKITVEGHEAAVLTGGRSAIENTRPFIFLNLVMMCGSDAQSLSAWLSSIDYLIFTLSSSAVLLERWLIPDCWRECVLVPREQVDLFRDVCRIHSLDLVRHLVAV